MPLPSTITPHESWHVIDSSKIQCAQTCMRKYFYEYILGWRLELSSYHLNFGTAIHISLEYLSLHGYDEASIYTAYHLFMDEYRKTQPPSLDDSNAPKNPIFALEALTMYAKRFGKSDMEEQTIYTEVAGSVPVDSKRVIHFRMDKILKNHLGYVVRDYKTGSRSDKQWRNQWYQKIQIGTYTHAARCLFDKVWGMEIRGIFFYKGQHKDRAHNFNTGTSKGSIDFQTVSIRKSIPNMEDWRWTVIEWMDSIEREMERLNKCSEDDMVMQCYPKNTESCNKYGGCPYLDFCMAWANPISRCAEPPPNYEVVRWDPRSHEKTAKHVQKGGEIV